MKTPLKETKPIGQHRSIVHLHFRDKPHEFREMDVDDYDDVAGEKFRIRRKELGLTLRTVAALLRVSAVVISEIERGRKVPADGYTIDDVIKELEYGE